MPTAGPPPSPLPTHLYKILLPADLPSAASAIFAPGESGKSGEQQSPPPLPLPDDTILPGTALDKSDGFVHLSTREQVQGVLERFFTGAEQGEILLLRLDYQALVAFAESQPEAKVQWDQAGHGVFAHLYGADLQGSVVRGWRIVRWAEQGWAESLRAIEGEGWFVD